MTPEQLRSQIDGKGLGDVLIGAVFEDGEDRCYLMWDVLYLALGPLLLKLSTIRTTGTMAMRFVAKMHCERDVDGGVVAFASIAEQLLLDPDHTVTLEAVRLWQPSTVDGELCCLAAQFDLSNGQELFVDPSYHFGFRLGGADQRRTWFENWPGARNAEECILTLKK
jgi:hypothetical protein